MNTDKLVIVRTYRGQNQSWAAKQMALEAPELAGRGYAVAAQSWAAGGRTPAARLFLVVGVVLLVAGLLVPPLWVLALIALVIGLVSGHGRGELSVTWSRTQ